MANGREQLGQDQRLAGKILRLVDDVGDFGTDLPINLRVRFIESLLPAAVFAERPSIHRLIHLCENSSIDALLPRACANHLNTCGSTLCGAALGEYRGLNLAALKPQIDNTGSKQPCARRNQQHLDVVIKHCCRLLGWEGVYPLTIVQEDQSVLGRAVIPW